MNQNTRRTNLRRMARRRRQTGELSWIEGGGVLAGAALLALLAVAAGHFAMDRIHALQFRNEASMFHSGVLDATATDTDFANETLGTLAQNHAFDEAGSRVSTTNGTLTGMFGGSVTAAPGMVSTADDSIALTYPLPAVVCSLSVAALSDTYSMVTVNGTTVSGPNTAFSSATAATACASAGPTASVGMYATRN
ncbi:MAG: type 4 pilus major pilin [Paraburkholderia sp.]|jgi:hypothetical protein|uniref:type 4 pilus major pilin n=1 Tax=Burkholderiaceae TaxID=119060 RepID=UPI0010FA4D10|nr:type 4 pilus major pilin [Burkholderia sp. 4M9327F10]